MSTPQEIYLGNGEHTLYSDEEWFLLSQGEADEVRLEARFQSDAPGRTGWPHWTATEFCVEKTDETARCQVIYDTRADLLAASKLSFVPAPIWQNALNVVRKEPKNRGN